MAYAAASARATGAAAAWGSPEYGSRLGTCPLRLRRSAPGRCRAPPRSLRRTTRQAYRAGVGGTRPASPDVGGAGGSQDPGEAVLRLCWRIEPAWPPRGPAGAESQQAARATPVRQEGAAALESRRRLGCCVGRPSLREQRAARRRASGTRAGAAGAWAGTHELIGCGEGAQQRRAERQQCYLDRAAATRHQSYPVRPPLRLSPPEDQRFLRPPA